jgi:predicted flap endonuclease-1-like 5' DNA nuclease
MTSSSDLPPIGRPAAAALEQAGITTLRQVAGRSASELLALHGVGPKAVRVLREALAAECRTFRGG